MGDGLAARSATSSQLYQHFESSELLPYEKMRQSLSTLLPLAVASLLVVQSLASDRDFNFYYRRQQERSKRAIEAALSQPSLEERTADYRYYNSKTKPYFIEKWRKYSGVDRT